MAKRIEVSVLSEQDIVASSPSRAEIIGIIERTYLACADEGASQIPTKIGVHPGTSPGSFCHAMPAWIAPERALGMKWISYFPGNGAAGLGVPDSSGIIVLNDPDNGMPLAILEGMWITYARTAACAAVAARHLAADGAVRLGLVGCGGLGKWSLRMLSEALPALREIRVASRSKESRERFCREMSAEGPWNLVPVDSNEDAVRGMDIVVSSIQKTATPQALESWWSAGTLVIPLDVAGCWDVATFERADRVITDGYAAFVRAAARDRPALNLPESRHVRLEDVVAGRAPGRASPHERAIAIPTGVASVDMTLAWEIYRRARDAGRGTKVALT